jgi:hypothetical protein
MLRNMWSWKSHKSSPQCNSLLTMYLKNDIGCKIRVVPWRSVYETQVTAK